MEVLIEEPWTLPEGSLLSIRAGSTRRQAPISSLKVNALRFPQFPEGNEPIKIDILQSVGSKRLVLHPEEELYQVDFDSNAGQMSCGIRVRADAGGTGEKVKRSTANVEGALKYHEAASQAKQYLESHCLLQYFQGILHAIVQEQPDNPYRYMWEQVGTLIKDKGSQGGIDMTGSPAPPPPAPPPPATVAPGERGCSRRCGRRPASAHRRQEHVTPVAPRFEQSSASAAIVEEDEAAAGPSSEVPTKLASSSPTDVAPVPGESAQRTEMRAPTPASAPESAPASASLVDQPALDPSSAPSTSSATALPNDVVTLAAQPEQKEEVDRLAPQMEPAAACAALESVPAAASSRDQATALPNDVVTLAAQPEQKEEVDKAAPPALTPAGLESAPAATSSGDEPALGVSLTPSATAATASPGAVVPAVAQSEQKEKIDIPTSAAAGLMHDSALAAAEAQNKAMATSSAAAMAPGPSLQTAIPESNMATALDTGSPAEVLEVLDTAEAHILRGKLRESFAAAIEDGMLDAALRESVAEAGSLDPLTQALAAESSEATKDCTASRPSSARRIAGLPERLPPASSLSEVEDVASVGTAAPPVAHGTLTTRSFAAPSGAETEDIVSIGTAAPHENTTSRPSSAGERGMISIQAPSSVETDDMISLAAGPSQAAAEEAFLLASDLGTLPPLQTGADILGSSPEGYVPPLSPVFEKDVHANIEDLKPMLREAFETAAESGQMERTMQEVIGGTSTEQSTIASNQGASKEPEAVSNLPRGALDRPQSGGDSAGLAMEAATTSEEPPPLHELNSELQTKPDDKPAAQRAADGPQSDGDGVKPAIAAAAAAAEAPPLLHEPMALKEAHTKQATSDGEGRGVDGAKSQGMATGSTRQVQGQEASPSDSAAAVAAAATPHLDEPKDAAPIADGSRCSGEGVEPSKEIASVAAGGLLPQEVQPAPSKATPSTQIPANEGDGEKSADKVVDAGADEAQQILDLRAQLEALKQENQKHRSAMDNIVSSMEEVRRLHETTEEVLREEEAQAQGTATGFAS